MNKKPKVFVALSGGVDSSVAAALLKRAGFNVSGYFMKFWREGQSRFDNPCCSPAAERRARIVSQKMKIPFFVFDFEKEFKKEVVDFFLKQNRLGLTPNPCVVCNEEIKFGLFLKKALKMGADFVATGHYARLRERKTKNEKRKIFELLKGKDKEKDQSYFLWRLKQEQLKRVLFPIGDYAKSDVRDLARKFNLPTAKTAESQNLCFLVSGGDKFLKFHLKIRPGRIVDAEGKVIGRHPGLAFFTIGQRAGLVPCLFPAFRARGPYFVLSKDRQSNSLRVTRKEKDLDSRKFVVKELNWPAGKPQLPLKVKVKIRSRQKESIASLRQKGNQVEVRLKRSERAVTPGQSAVFYQGQKLLGGGVIV